MIDQVMDITSEQEWLSFIDEQLKSSNKSLPHIRFVGWPTLEIIIDGDRYNGTLPTELMRGFVEFQDEFYRGYAQLRYKTKNTQRLSLDDRERLEFVFKIEDNCTKSIADESELLNTIADHLEKIFLNMTGEQQLLGLAILVFSFTGYKVFEKFSDNGLKGKEIDAGNEALRLQKQAVVDAIAASNNIPANIEHFKCHAESAFRSVFKSAAGAKSISIGTDSWTQQEIAEIVKKPEKNKERKELSMPLFIEGIKRNRGYLSVNVVDEDNKNFSMRVDLTIADPDEVEQLFDAFKASRSIKITFTAKKIDGEIDAGSFIELTPKLN